ncbi:IS3 family transposase [Ruegeria sp. B32]|nr:IS3 family transposase [Ruegeria sp. B32]UWR08988.1 IS3 family transposase [Ruegeria sp. B32]
MIRRDHPDLSINQQCRLVKLSRSAFYFTPIGINAATLALTKQIDRVFTKYPFFGSRQIAAYLRWSGMVAGRHRIRRLVAKMGLEAICKRPRTSQPHPQHPVYPYLLRKMRIDRPNQVWCADITFIPVNGRLPVLGCHNGLGNPQGSELAAQQHDARRLLRRGVEESHQQVRSPEIMNTDQGSQFTGSAWVTTLSEAGVRISMDGRGRCMDNIFI